MSLLISRFVVGALGCWLVLCAPVTVCAVDFDRDVRPLLNQHCLACHGGVKQTAGLSMVYPDALADYVTAGDPQSSALYERIASADADERMPPPEHGRALNAEETAVIQQWIQEGAEWKSHWAYRLPQRHPLPQVTQADWCRQPVDYFVLRQLEQRGIQPAPLSEPVRWLRRAALDLVGLPPTTVLREEFLQQLRESPDSAYAQAVDRMLASSRFGERWASIWFDLVRYADSQGLGQDRNRTMWPYRDWVIRALNDDMPYDEFTRQQIAGDLLPEATLETRLATTVHRLTQTNSEGGTDDEEFRVAAVLDRVNTVWQTWHGVTFGCAQCHDHPYDPITQEDFYRFVALFNNTADTDSGDEWPTMPVPRAADERDTVNDLVLASQEVRRRLWSAEYAMAHEQPTWIPTRLLEAQASAPAEIVHVDGRDQFMLTGNPRTGLSWKVDCQPVATTKVAAIRLTVLPLDPVKAKSNSEWGFVVTDFRARLTKGNSPVGGDAEDVDGDPSGGEMLSLEWAIGDEPFPRYEPVQSLRPNSKEGFTAFTRINLPRQVVFVLREPVEMQSSDTLQVTIRCDRGNEVQHPLIVKRGYLDVCEGDLADQLRDKKLRDDRQRLRSLKQELDKLETTSIPILVQRPAHLLRSSHVFLGGLFLTKGQQVESGYPQALQPSGAVAVSDRVALAQFMTSADNPLTARVIVNRYWAQLFGTGLVDTEEDFGSSGSRPSHPALLDDLAVRFQTDMGWSLKKLLRELVLSSAYRQSAHHRPELSDPRNRLLARGPRGILPAESIRDQALAISGLLSDKMYGPPVYPPLPARVWTPFEAHEKWETPDRGDEDRYRRSIYTHVKRTIPYPLQTAFDAPSREFCNPRRLRSNTPLQALMTMNDEVFVECAEALAAQMKNHAEEVSAGLQYGFLVATGRPPKPAELQALQKLVTEQADSDKAWISAALVLLNLDEVLTR